MSAMKKIAVILSTFPQEGGQHQYETLLAELLMKNAAGRYELLAFCQNSFWLNWCRKNHVRYYCLKQSYFSTKEIELNVRHSILSGIYHRFFGSVGKLLGKERINLIICGQQGIFLPNYFIKEIRPVHDLMHRYEGKFPEIGSSYAERELLFQNVARNAAVVLVDSTLGKTQFEESYLRNRLKGPKIRILPYIIPRHVLELKGEEVAVPKKYVFYPAQFWEHKNHIHLVKAIFLLKEKIPDICLVLTGSEKNALQYIKKYVKEKKLEENVIIMGFVSNENITFLYKHAVGLVMPTNFGPTNIPPLEAMALGCPVAVSNKYAMPQQVGKAGLLFDPDSPEEIADCIQQMWTNESLRQKMIQEGYYQMKKWTAEDFEKTFIKIVIDEL